MTGSEPTPDSAGFAVKVDAKEHPISGVTVYLTNRAVVERTFVLKLKAGQNDISISHLPNVLDPDSLRVEAHTIVSSTTPSNQSLTVFDVSYISSTRTPKPLESTPELEDLEDRKSSLDTQLEVFEAQKSLLGGYAEGLQNGTVKDAHAGSTSEGLESFMGLFGSKRMELHAEETRVRKELRVVEREIGALRQKRGEAMKDEDEKRKAGVKVVLLVGEEAEVELGLSYLVNTAPWRSLYDIRADLTSASGSSKDGKPSIKLQYRADITQSTGEDWTNVALTLSTASPLLGSSIPVLQPARVGAYTPRPMSSFGSRKAVAAGASFGAGPLTTAIPPPAPAPVMMARRRGKRLSTVETDTLLDFDEQQLADVGPTVSVKAGAISSSFAIEGLSNIPSDGSSHKVSIATIELSADLEWVTVPRMMQSAFLQCRIKNTSEYQLIEGRSSIFLDGNFVSKSSVPTVSPNESFACSLGVDPSVRITYHPQSKSSSTSGGGLMGISSKSSVTWFKQRITIKNTRPISIARLVVQDRVPVSEDSRIKVNVFSPSEKAIGPVGGPSSVISSSASSAGAETLVDTIGKNVLARWAQKNEENGGSGGSKGDGVIEWIVSDLKESIDLNLAYDITAPADLRWVDL